MPLSKWSKLFGLLAAAIFLAFGLMALPIPRAAAQTGGQGKLEGELVDGTKDAKLSNTDSLTVTLHMAPAGATSTISQTTKSDSAGHFTFSNLDTITTTRYLLIANYQGVDYFSDILSFDQNKTTLPVSMTVYETTSDPAAIHVTQTHVVFDVQTREFNVLQIVAVQNTTDRTYVGGTGFGPHRVTLTLPFLQGGQNIEFDNPAANDSTLRGSDTMSYTLPVVPGGDQIVYNYTLPFNPPTYQFNMKLPFDTDKFRILLSDVGGTIQSTQLTSPTPFPTQNGMQFILSSADNVKAGTTVNATFANLPATVAAPPPSSANPAIAPTSAVNNNLQVVGGVVLGVAALAAIGLLLYPVVKRRRAHAAHPVSSPASGRRMELLQEMANLDDAFEAQKISESEYKERRTQIKADLLELTKGEE
jgi:hypothetical protein